MAASDFSISDLIIKPISQATYLEDLCCKGEHLGEASLKKE